jgi:hypothetical protein
MKKQLNTLGLLLAISLGQAQAQEADRVVTASAGGQASLTGGYSLDFTVGEAVMITSGSNPIFTHGFLQPFSTETLPVELLGFTGKAYEGFNLLSWKTSSEKDNSHFVVERRISEDIYEQLGTVPSKAKQGNSDTLMNYNFRDLHFESGTNYYRLQQVDFNGKSKYTEVVAIQSLQLAAQELWVAPNPVDGSSKLYVKGNIGVSANAQLIDLSGKIIKEIRIASAATLIDMSTFSPGIYLLRYTDQFQKKTLRLIKP